MSWRTWLGSDRKSWAESNLCDFPDIYSLCEDSGWQFPRRAYAPEPEIMKRFLRTMRIIIGVTPESFSDLQIGDVGAWTPFILDSETLKYIYQDTESS